ncbi:MAG TPA: competence protein CoiA family protein [Planctomycetota bacterium]|nr:competence protein CoiA family protein [Planctomycetota bacterium]
MFRAFDVERGHDVISLESFDALELDRLRRKSAEAHIHCPTCKHPVSFKAGTIRRPHFAHKHLSDCPAGNELPELLAARAVLYDWLKTKFNDGVTLEQPIDGAELPRAVDCWVNYKDKRLAYWIVTNAIQKPESRQLIKDAATKAHADLHLVFLSTMMRRNEAPNGELNLTTTERDFLGESAYDKIYCSPHHYGHGSLHYLDTEARTLITFRAMQCIEDPGRYKGTERQTTFADVMVSPLNGEFVLPGEHERLVIVEAEEKKKAAEALARRKVLEARLKAEAEERARQFEVWERKRREREVRQQAEAERRRASQPVPPIVTAVPLPKRDTASGYEWGGGSESSSTTVVPVAREFPCEMCGKLTFEGDASVWTPKTQTCKCRTCMNPKAPMRAKY